MDGLTVNAGSFKLVPSGGNQIAGTIVVAADGQSATFTPSAPLVTETRYTVELFNGIADLEGQGLQTFFSSFTTGAQ